ncbi:restriction endonuclease [Neisseria sicca]|uniref:Restriction endonuclease n=1 Tax=Neisseria sicca TaxID=490 RepID=A0A2I1XFG0_NEISI|nr:restriction endonuclease subunit S [Neisseria sicca]PLA41369.1 restriction endonuclease [Neisseria sicca]
MTTEQQLPEGWEKTTLGEIATYVNGRAFKPIEWSKTGTPIVRIQNLNNPNAEYNYYDGYIEEKYHIENGDLLFAWSASLGAYIWKGKSAFLNQHIFKVLPKENVDKTFIYYLLDKVTSELYAKAHGSGMVHVTKGKFEATSVNIPPLETQQAIVNKIESLFDEIDEGIGRLKTAAQQIQQYRQSLLKNAFNGELTKEWRSKHADTLPSENELLAQIQTAREQHHAQQLADWQTAVSQWEQNGKEGKKPSKPSSLSSVNILSKDSELPENWLLTEAESICDFITKGTTPPKNELFMKSGEVPFLKVYNLTKNGKLDFTIEPTFVSKETHNNFLNRSKVYPNDILMNIVGPPLGKVSLVPDDYPEWNINQAIVIYRSIFVHSKFLANYLLAEKTIKLMSSQAKTTAGQHNLTLEICRNLPIPVCSLAEQTQIVAILESKLTACDQLAAELAKQLKQAELLKQAVLKAAFSGNLLDK